MSTMNISLPDSLKEFVDEQVEQRGYGTSSEYVRELIRKEQDCLQLRELLLEGASSDALEHAYSHIGRHPGSGSSRYAHELNLPGRRFWPLQKHPHLIFYVERSDHVDVWRS